MFLNNIFVDGNVIDLFFLLLVNVLFFILDGVFCWRVIVMMLFFNDVFFWLVIVVESIVVLSVLVIDKMFFVIFFICWNGKRKYKKFIDFRE